MSSGVPLIESQSESVERLDSEHGDQAPTCKKCPEAVVAGNYGFCAVHRTQVTAD
jgi:hypothetical protein